MTSSFVSKWEGESWGNYKLENVLSFVDLPLP